MVRDWRPSREDWLPRVLLGLWALFYLCYLLVMVKEKSARYLIILLPFCYCLVFLSLAWFSRWLASAMAWAGSSPLLGMMSGSSASANELITPASVVNGITR